MEWFVDEPHRGQITLGIIALVIGAVGIWLGRKKLFLAVPAVLAFLFLAAIAIPSAIPARTAAQRQACIHNLRILQNAKSEWATQYSKLATDFPIEADLYSTNGNGILRHPLKCPRGGTYIIGTVRENPTCSLSNKGHRLE